MYYIYGSTWAIPTYRVYRLYDRVYRLYDYRVYQLYDTGDSKIPWLATILSRVVAIGWGTETVQYKKESNIVSQVNRTCPLGQTDTIPNGDSVMDVPVIDEL